MPSSADTLRDHLAQVEQLRQAAQAATPAVQAALASVRSVQVRRFHACYADFLDSPRHGQAARFFLTELYGSHDYRQRDAQFARIAGAIERLFPAKVMALAVQLAEVHALTETLDWTLTQRWAALPTLSATDEPQASEALARRYLSCWRQVGRRADRDRQLQAVMALGWHMAEVVRIPGLRTGLRLMRGPAKAAGLAALQQVLEDGFDAFTSMGQPDGFLIAVQTREADWIACFFDTPLPQATLRLGHALASAPAAAGT
ncbi:MAG: hypothetical protein C0445_14860 [Polaromonas sp.]|nr:hypothetical protein [Polaromonas sp.]